MIRVLLADDHKIVREGLRRIIEESGEMEVVAEAEDGTGAIKGALEAKPDVAVIDISMPGLDGLEVTDILKRNAPDLPVLILTMHDEDQYVIKAVETGAMGYVTKQSAPEQLVDAIKKLHSGGRYLTEKASEALALRVVRGDKFRSATDSLSMRELQVLRKLALGHTNHEIAASYNISVKTVDTYRARVLKKLNLRNNADLSRFAIKNRIVEL
ncbi:two component transcriptional regulator (LuxR family protein) [Desulforapulum autotrophicum HRM2]|uniref:Two component transcriptional regulator (LuxR family protein) n=1 Tax=Desulforapulum autotrophicum (strain ATCC 43914 / DSM 3382 / VKM B-1955 / HRM2) TaxID=177437 RepID=C0Q8Z1_DESAH|nr:response regulator transcription factor [Desulforapulum autotrophicum]ACN14481.1 two component transcriptional regulator (LuxR family protein) [Desulforapulum autotrophicum HRM2]